MTYRIQLSQHAALEFVLNYTNRTLSRFTWQLHKSKSDSELEFSQSDWPNEIDLPADMLDWFDAKGIVAKLIYLDNEPIILEFENKEDALEFTLTWQ